MPSQFDPIPPAIKKHNLENALQQAINLEIATIPTYLYTYYSLKRSWEQNQSSKSNQEYNTELDADIIISSTGASPNKLKTAEGLRQYIQENGTNVSEAQAREMALTIQVYANKSAATIMSVVIEEMLHMALTSNVKQALFSAPKLIEGLPSFPVDLPGHSPILNVNLGKFSQKQLKTFLRIESPKPYEKGSESDKNTKEISYTTIGKFYHMIENCIKENYFYDKNYSNRPQLIPTKGYYSQNSINTVYYDKKHQPQFMNEEDSGGLIHVSNLKTALKAMSTVTEQGEGRPAPKDKGCALDENGKPQCACLEKPGGITYDDSSKKEESHFIKFLELYCEGKKHIQDFNAVGLDFHSFFVYQFPENPSTEYDDNKKIQAILKLINAIYTYTFLMVETCYYKEGNTQYEIFMFGVHKSMIWCISRLCNTISSWSIMTEDNNVYNIGASFEPYLFEDNGISPKQQMLDLAENYKNHMSSNDSKDCKDSKRIIEVIDNLKTFPDVSLNHQTNTPITS